MKNITVTFSSIDFNNFRGFLLKTTLLLCFCTILLAPAIAGNGGVKDIIPSTKIDGVNFLNNALNSAAITFTNGTETSSSITNIISLVINEETTTYIPESFEATVDLKIEFGPDASSITTLPTVTLKVGYNKVGTTTYSPTPRSYYTLKDAKYVKVTILNSGYHFTSTNSNTFDPKNLLKVENELIAYRYYTLATNAQINSLALTNPAADVVHADWTYTPSASTIMANAAQLEWVWVENPPATPTAIEYTTYFRNATRIDFIYPKQSYNIPLLYDGIGKLFVRVRPVNFDKDGNRQDGLWGTILEQAFTGHQPNLNWQATTSFAEEGKSKTVISYFDGTLRSRQTVTKDNETGNIVTAETMYDLQGRAAIQILPTPGITNVIQYQSNLNLFNSSSNVIQPNNIDPAFYFDLNPTPLPLSTTTGTSQYYSNANTSGNPNTPDAAGYPYTITRFTPDATGRIQEQSGVGATHKIGSDHTTKYYYSTPAQEELDALFGTEVGDYSHYSKNMVKDANGQLSISYVDMHGRTIATALTGAEPNNIERLSSASGTASITKNLAPATTNIVKNNTKIESISTLLADITTNYEFNYILNPQEFRMPTCSTGNFCYDLLYDLEFVIKDESEETVNAAPISLKFKNYDPNAAVAGTCIAPAFTQDGTASVTPTIVGNKITFNVLLPIGSYSVRKTLSISESSLSKYKAAFEQNRICSTLTQITNAQFSILETQTGCNSATPVDKCVACSTLLAGTKTDYENRFLIALYPNNPDGSSTRPIPVPASVLTEIGNTYQSEVSKCNKLCNNAISQALPTIRDMMILDMIPYTGQYATNNKNAALQGLTKNSATGVISGIPKTLDKYNIFQDLMVSSSKPFYKHPKTYDPTCTVSANCDLYFDEYGQKSTNLYASDPLHPGHNILENMSPDDFEKNFQNSWAKSLLPYHPEYQKLVFAENYLGHAYNWVNAFTNTDEWGTATTGAVGLGYVFAPGDYLHPSDIKDKLFIASTTTPAILPPGATEYNDLLNKVNVSYQGGLSMWKIAYGNVFCKDITDATARQTCFSNAPARVDLVAAHINTLGLDINTKTAKLNQIWKNFRGLYAAERNKIVNKFIYSQGLNNADCDAIAVEIKNYTPLPTDNPNFKPYRLHFPKDDEQQAQQSGAGSWWPTDWNDPNIVAGNITTLANAGTTDEKESKCSGYIALWKAQLSECPAIAGMTEANRNTILTEITNGLKTVCKYGYDPIRSPDGASDIPNTLSVPSGTPTSFEKVINDVFTSHGINRTNLCNPYMIEWPKPYGKGPVMVETISNKIEGCNCKEFDKIKADATAHSVSTTNLVALNTYLQTTYGETISQTLFDSLQKCNSMASVVCEPAPNPTYHNTCDPELLRSLPEGYKNVHKKEQVLGKENQTTPIAVIKPYTRSNGDEFDKLNFDYVNCLDLIKIANDYMNHSTLNDGVKKCQDGFVFYFNNIYTKDFSFLQIVDIYKQHCCTMPDLCLYDLNCKDYLQKTLDAYWNDPSSANPENCKESFTEFFNTDQNLNPRLSWEEICDLYLKKCKKILDVCMPRLECTEIEVILANFVHDYNVDRLENCKETFTNYFNEQAHSNPSLSWEEISSLYFTKCNHNLVICVPKLDCEKLTSILSTFKLENENVNLCRANFVHYFNHNVWYDFKVEYNWDEIVAIYDKCDLKLEICKPVFDCKELKNAIYAFHSNYDVTNGGEEDCHTNFINFFNCYFGISPKITDWSEIVAIYQRADCDLSNVCRLTFDCNKLAIIYNGFKAKYLSSNINTGSEWCVDKWEEYFHEQQVLILGMSSTIWLSKNDIEDIYINSGCMPIDCTPVLTCANLYLLEQEDKRLYGNAPVTEADFRTRFIDLFNQYFSPTITSWSELVSIYSSQGSTPPSFTTVCNTIYTGSILLPSTTVIPQFLKCGGGSTERCLSCNEIVNLTSQFKIAFPASQQSTTLWNMAPVINNTVLNESEINANVIFGKFINYKTGLQFTWMDYLKAISTSSCSIYKPQDIIIVPPTGGGESPSNVQVLQLDIDQPQNVICGSSKPLTVPTVTPVDPCQGSHNMAIAIAQNIYNNYVQTRLADFENGYRTQCLAAKSAESFTVTYTSNEYHYTLYYYDQAGSLVKTVPPAGIDNHASYVSTRTSSVDAPITGPKAFTYDVSKLRYKYPGTNNYNFGLLCTAQLTPDHRLVTNYRYNTLNQVIAQNTPDAGTSNFWYDALGRLAISQNAKQQLTGDYSYTLYDLFGRISEVGQIHPTSALTLNEKITDTKLTSWLYTAPAVQVTRTEYDLSYFRGTNILSPDPVTQENLRNRVSYTAVYNQLTSPGSITSYDCINAATYYSYDIHGNVNTLVQDYGKSMGCTGTDNSMNAINRHKKITYDYDLISGKVNQVNYQPNQPDQFYHRYNYDAENRLTCVETSHDAVYWERDAKYQFYQHGPLQRTVLGQQQVQGIDYAYTIQGWLKGVNTTNFDVAASGTLGSSFDMGQDGTTTNPTVAKDVYGFGLQYYTGDYKGIGNAFNNPFFTVLPNMTPLADGMQVGKSLYNGNISSMYVNIPSLAPSGATGNNAGALVYGYRYDQLNRIVGMNAHTPNYTSSPTFMGTTVVNKYMERVTYDPNGNIVTYKRSGNNATTAASIDMDNMTYGYNKDASGNIVNNKLRHVKDAIGNANYVADIDDQNDDNYEYDAIGNLIIDRAEGIYNLAATHEHDPMIEWTVYGKIAKITKMKYVGANLETTTINYNYDASGNRIGKVVTKSTSTTTETSETWYVRDASGNTMSVYEKKATLNGNNLTQTEVNLYGSSRLGVLKINRDMITTPLPLASGGAGSYTRGNKLFELSNHLGNVLVTITDRKIQISNGAATNPSVAYYEADIVTATDYYPFGMAMPGRKYTAPSASEHRYGFNGKENDKDISEGGQDYGMRISDTRLGRFLSVDPITKSYPMLTPYQFASNKPINGVDLDGKEFVLTIFDPTAANEFDLAVNTYSDIYKARKIAFDAINSKMSESDFKKLTTAKPMGWGDELNIFIPTNNQKATLEYDKNAPQGLTIELNRGQQPLASGGYGQVWHQTLHCDKGTDKGYEDKSYPVDVRTINSPDYGNTYKTWDFVGEYSNTNSNLWVGTASRGDVWGYLKGSGFVSYGVDAIGVSPSASMKGGFGISVSSGSIFGKSTGLGSLDPSALSGWGAQVGGGYSFGIGVEGGAWGSFNTKEDAKNFNLKGATFTGVYTGFSVGASASFKKKPPTPSTGGSITPAVSFSTLKEPVKP